MGVGEPKVSSVCPRWARLFEAVPAPPIVVGCGIGASLVLGFLAFDAIEGRLGDVWSGAVPWWGHVEVRSALIVSALLAGVVTTHRYEELGTAHDLARLVPVLRLDEAGRGDLQRASAATRPPRLRAASLLGAALITAVVPALYVDPSRFLSAEPWRLPSVWIDLVVGAALGWTTFRTLFAALEQDRAFADLSRSVATVDLLDLEPLHAFSRRGLRRALRWLLLSSVAGLVFMDAGYATLPALVLVGIVVVALWSFVLPIRGIHARVRAEKRSTLEALRKRVRAERDRLHDDEIQARLPGGRLADLLALEARVAAVPEWPIDGATFVRLALYLTLPLGSWVGGALVQHAIEGWLGGRAS